MDAHEAAEKFDTLIPVPQIDVMLSLKGYEMLNMLQKGQIQGIKKIDIEGQDQFIVQIFGVAA